MICKQSIEAAYPLASILTRQGVTLAVSDPSPLAHLVAICQGGPDDENFVQADGTPVVEVRSLEDAIEAASVDEDGYGVSDHDETMADIVHSLARSVSATFNFTRTVVNPQIDKVVTDTVDYVDQHMGTRGFPLSIRTEALGPADVSSTLSEMVSPYAGGSYSAPAPIRMNHVMPKGGVLEALSSGDTYFDSEVAKQLKDRQSDISDLWTEYFSAAPGKYRSVDISKDLADIDRSKAIFLGASRLLAQDEPPEGLEVPLASYRGYLADLRNVSGSAIARRLDIARQRDASKMLVITSPKGDERDPPKGEIVVNRNVYNQWLKEGGSPEALLQAVHEGRPVLTYAALLKDSDALAKRWSTTEGLINAQRRFRAQSVITTGLRRALMALFASQPDDLKAMVPYRTANEFAQALNERLSHYHVKDLEKIHMVARKAVCRLLYPHTDAERVLNAMDAVMHQDPELSPKAAETSVMIDYVTDYLVSAIAVMRD